jgi:hypothetical protein
MLELACACTPNAELLACTAELHTLADTVQFTTAAQPEWSALFTVDGAQVDATLRAMAAQLEARVNDCPCIGPCSAAPRHSHPHAGSASTFSAK